MKLNFALVTLLASSHLFWHSPAHADEPKLTLCDSCSSSSQFAQAAESAALSEPPLLLEGVGEVFVINSVTEEVRFFVVTREFVGESDGFGDGFWVTTSSPATAPANSIAEIQQGIQAGKDFLSSLVQVDIGDLDLGPVEIGSAADLLGPDDDPVVTARRGTLQNALANYYDALYQQIYISLADLASRAIERFLPDRIGQFRITVRFPDGSSIRLNIQVARNFSTGKFEFIFEVDPGSAQGPGLAWIPVTSGEFMAVFGNTFTSDARFVDALGDLFVRGGGRTERVRSGGGCTGTMECWTETEADGNVVERCRVTLPKDELKDC